ncbi:multicopper oxidase domain-containing protein [Cohaesibacter celericrescens]|uniref:Biphenyl 2,3-dioxygenase n=1 Tax=Cohaesibacter celericrescens TaxID=2067669 RepID=A0A2N5XJW9_9HYPH|nr:multicopper oxidase domain-containing protein [Cohaesibacter celericrescens]PLW74823.1 biphenyl 2,3-dioxygenase [Cohaesibacter celericrescens]
MNRRQFLTATAVAGGGLSGLYTFGNGSDLSAATLANKPRLKMPSLLDTRQTKTAELVAQKGSSTFIGNAANQTFGFNQPYLGPTLVLENGDFNPVVKNQLSRPISVHWHGLLVRGEHDGGPHIPVIEGQEWRPEMLVNQAPATLWYHTHIHQQTAHDVHKGLAGIIHLTDGRDDDRSLPNTYGVDDVTLVLQDRRFDDRGFVSYELSMPDLMHGFTGETMLINGQYGAVCSTPKGIARLRLVYGSNAKIYSLFFEDQRDFQLIATDAGFLDQPQSLTKLPLAPGERAEILVDFSSGQPAMLMSDGDPNQGPGGMMGRMRGMVDLFVDRSISILPFAVDEQLPTRITSFPDQLEGPGISLREQDVIQTRSLSLDMGMMGGGGGGGGFAINGESFDMRRINLEVALGTTEKWRVQTTMLSHPFHIHGAIFKVLSEEGNAPLKHNTGFKDTVLVRDQTELLVRFDHPASQQNPFMYHCHILEHEDAGMMGQFTVS